MSEEELEYWLLIISENDTSNNQNLQCQYPHTTQGEVVE